MAQTEIRRKWEALLPNDVGTEMLEAMIAAAETTEIELAALGGVPDCPPGCQLEPGHEYDSSAADHDDENGRPVFVRIHRLYRDEEAAVEVDQYEYNSAAAGVVLEPPHIWQGNAEGSYDATQIRQMAAGMLNAADELDRLSGATR